MATKKERRKKVPYFVHIRSCSLARSVVRSFSEKPQNGKRSASNRSVASLGVDKNFLFWLEKDLEMMPKTGLLYCTYCFCLEYLFEASFLSLLFVKRGLVEKKRPLLDLLLNYCLRFGFVSYVSRISWVMSYCSFYDF
ncbi:hypothetical protein NPIL_203041 [Nephila pilipes]|uniref:Uncharacterized protein n=1 Tax=Nephila pilipes TaxID=299642 RepID=A0A8X6QK89_NEPPI|nr:hypothetical protein NPIL_546541 [Nephila pilipes]GFU31357.1 hypothetical protein NPIL_203041 [Nephila pilipes]